MQGAFGQLQLPRIMARRSTLQGRTDRLIFGAAEPGPKSGNIRTQHPVVVTGCGRDTTALRKKPRHDAANTNVTSLNPAQAPTEGVNGSPHEGGPTGTTTVNFDDGFWRITRVAHAGAVDGVGLAGRLRE